MEEKYSLSLRLLHWLVAIIIIEVISIGLVMEYVPRENPIRNILFDLHKSFGVVVFFLFFVRFIVRITSKVPPLPSVISKTEQTLAHIGHYVLYIFMLIMPVSGYAMSNSFGYPVKLFGLQLPMLFEKNEALAHKLASFHENAGFVLIALILLHITGLIVHYKKHAVNLIQRML